MLHNLTEVTFGDAVIKGGLRTKLTLLISGFGCLTHGQIVKGLIFFAFQIITITCVIFFGWPYLQDVNTLGTVTMGQQFDPVHEIYVNVKGDNSLQILLYSIFTIAIIVFGLFMHFLAVKSAYAAEVVAKRGKRPNSIVEDFYDLFDKNLHATILTPPAIGVIMFTVIPIIFMILLAFTNFDRRHQPPGNLFTWVGLANFSDIFNFGGTGGTMGYTFIRVLGWTLIWAVLATFLNYFFGMFIAMLINKKGIRYKAFWRTSLVIAIAIPGFVTLLFMRQILNDMGPINTILQDLGFAPVQFLREPTIARITVVIVNLWIGIPYTMLITSGILMNIPADLYEAAEIDGAGIILMFRKITLPYIFAVTTPYLITQFIGNINNFNAIFFLTGGGPSSMDYYLSTAGKTDLLVTWLYKLTVNFSDYNLASVIGIMAFLVSSIIALLTFNMMASAKKEETFR